MAMVRCPTCGARLELEDRHLGHEVDCGDCRATFVAQAEGDAPRPADYRPVRRQQSVERDDEGELGDRPRRRGGGHEYEERPRRSRRDRDGGDYEAALEAVRGPATGLQVVGWFGIAMGVLHLVMAAVLPILAMNLPPPPAGGGVNGPPNQLPPQTEMMINGIGAAVQGVVIIAVSILIITGANRMKRLESHGMAMASAIVAMVPCFSPCCLLGLPFGIMALQAMGKPEVKEAFDASRQD